MEHSGFFSPAYRTCGELKGTCDMPRAYCLQSKFTGLTDCVPCKQSSKEEGEGEGEVSLAGLRVWLLPDPDPLTDACVSAVERKCGLSLYSEGLPTLTPLQRSMAAEMEEYDACVSARLATACTLQSRPFLPLSRPPHHSIAPLQHFASSGPSITRSL